MRERASSQAWPRGRTIRYHQAQKMIDEAMIEGLARRILAGSQELSVERVTEGVSTYVYRPPQAETCARCSR